MDLLRSKNTLLLSFKMYFRILNGNDLLLFKLIYTHPKSSSIKDRLLAICWEFYWMRGGSCEVIEGSSCQINNNFPPLPPPKTHLTSFFICSKGRELEDYKEQTWRTFMCEILNSSHNRKNRKGKKQVANFKWKKVTC